MPKRKQTGHMWGCRIVWRYDPGEGPMHHEEWAWDTTARADDGTQYCPIVFTELRKQIMPFVKTWRANDQVKSARAVKVPIPEIP